jgi:hypothetical protein
MLKQKAEVLFAMKKTQNKHDIHHLIQGKIILSTYSQKPKVF